MDKKRLLFVFCAAILIPTLSGSQDPNQDTGSRAVQLNVVVTQNNEPVKNLQKADFKIFEDGKEIPPDSFEIIEKQPGGTGADDAKKLLVIFHDVSFWGKNIKSQAAELPAELVKLAKQGIEIMILEMGWKQNLKILQPFTSDAMLITMAAESALKSLGEDEIYGDMRVGGDVYQDEEKDKIYAAEAQRGSRQAFLVVQRRRFEKAMGGLLAASNIVKGSPGNKSVLLISPGIPDISSSNQTVVLNRETSGREALDAVHIRDQESTGKVRLFDPFGIMKSSEFNSAEEVTREIVRFANTNGISIYGLDPGVFSKSVVSTSADVSSAEDAGARMMSAENSNRQMQNLRLIAEETNASLFRGADKFDDLRRTVNADLSAPYQLIFEPQRKKADDQYHAVDIRVNREGTAIRARKGYLDYSKEAAKRALLVSAFYSPDTFKQLPFSAEFAAFRTEKGKNIPWMSIALPTQAIFQKIEESGAAKKTFELNVWLQKDGQKAYGGKLSLPFTLDSAFWERVKKTNFQWFFFTGPEIELEQGDYDVVYALVDGDTDEIGTWHSRFASPNMKKSETPVVLTCLLGAMANNPDKKKDLFTLNTDNGILEYGSLRFFPQVTNRFSAREGFLYVFLQVHDPQGIGTIKPEFSVSPQGGPVQTLAGELVAESWNKKLKMWDGIYKLPLSSVAAAENVLRVKLPGAEGAADSSREIGFVRLVY